MLWLALHFPRLPLEVFLRGAASHRPLAVAGGGRDGRIVACDPGAAALGVRPGMGAATARALAARLDVRPRDEAAEAAALAGIAAWAGQFTPGVSLQPPAGVLLEVAGSLALFGGPDGLLEHVRQGLAALGYRLSWAGAPTPLAAWLLARAGRECWLRRETELARRLSPLPLALLEPSPAAARTLAAVGARTVGDCLRLPRDGLARRLGPELVEALDRALGRLPDPRPPFAPPARFRGRLELPAEVTDTEALLFAARRLLLELEGFLRGRGSGVQQLRLELSHRRGPATALELGLAAPDRDGHHLLALLRERLNRIALPAPVSALALAADALLPYAPDTRPLFPDPASGEEDWRRLAERLGARLGAAAVQGLCPVADHRPERAWRPCPPGEGTSGASFGRRPLWLLVAPRPLPARRREPWLEGPLALETGPERIEGGWWDGGDAARDYFTARDRRGALLWIYRERREDGGWYLHGIFA